MAQNTKRTNMQKVDHDLYSWGLGGKGGEGEGAQISRYFALNKALFRLIWLPPLPLPPPQPP